MKKIYSEFHWFGGIGFGYKEDKLANSRGIYILKTYIFLCFQYCEIYKKL